MNQKQLILTVLEKIQPYRDMADIFSTWIESGMYDENFLDKLSVSLQQAMNKAKGGIELEKIKKASSIIQKIQSDENREGDIADADALLADI